MCRMAAGVRFINILSYKGKHMKKLLLVCFSVVALGLAGCSSTDELVKADGQETNKSKPKKRAELCEQNTGSRLAKKC